ncbi:leucine-zipper-like transcriptional regulator 1 [Microdochium nivale]|nr:leucine-zipper-like transcriptional regulator 1 [Microdochium nivale]
MAFLFKSKKNAERNAQNRDGAAAAARVEKAARSTPTGSLNSFDDASPSADPEKFAARRAAAAEQQSQTIAKQPQQQQVSDLPFRNGPTTNPALATAPAPAPAGNTSLYPWSQRRLTFTSSVPSPFPRYGAAVNSVSSKEGDIYIMGGLVNSSTVKGDLWMIEAGGSMSCFPLATTAEGPGPRVGHASLLVGNAYIVYGGDTKIEETDILDETLYLLNTSTRQWSRALPAGPRPSGRYGHSLNIVGSKIYIFGGQVEGYFMNDLCSFDLNELQMPNNRWKVLLESSEVSNPVQTVLPPARTNHSMITYDDKLYLFGGTNGFQWFNDVWCYDSVANLWSQLDCIGYIPVPREGHAAALVDDVMYVFGGRTEDGTDLGDLAAFRISSRRWYTFQNMGPSPSPRSGHSMTAVAKSIVVVGGEPSSATNQVNDLSITYLLDTTKIRYPNDAQIQSNTKPQQGRRPSGELAARGPSRDGSNGPDPKRIPGDPSSPITALNRPNVGDIHGPPISNGISKLPRTAGTSAPPGPPPQGQAPRPMVNTDMTARPRNASIDRIERERGGMGSPAAAASSHNSPIMRTESPNATGRGTPNQQQLRTAPVIKSESAIIEDVAKPKPARPARNQGSVDSSTEPGLKNIITRPASPPPPTRQASNPISRRGSNRNSQTVVLLKELDSSRNRIAWYASELELARKSGYIPNATLSPVLESRGSETFDDEDKPLVEALLAMRQELANVQASVDKQAVLAAKKIADAEKQRDAAIREAAYAKAKMAAHGSSATGDQARSGADSTDHHERSGELSQKLASSINRQKDLQTQLERRVAELDAEKRARQLADDTSSATQKRLADLEQYKQQTSLQVESLRADLHAAQREAREHSLAGAEAVAALQLLHIEKDDIQSRLDAASGESKEPSDTLNSLREAVAASAEMRSHLERKLDEERAQREKVEAKLTKIKAEHETRTAELVAVSQRLRDAEEIAERHAAEAKTHRQVVASGLEKLTRDGSKASKADAERLVILQGQVAAAKNLAKKYQQEADDASDKLRRAEERIAGLEAYQEQSSREGVTIRRQLQSALRDTQSLQAMTSDLKHQLSSQQLEANAISVQHNTLKDILAERGMSPTVAARTRGMGPGKDSPDPARTGELERQLAQAVAAHDETKQLFAGQAQEMESAYRERVAQLENDYQSAVHYVKGTEKMLKRMKEELAKYKSDNARLKSENIELEDRAAAFSGDDSAPSEWQEERTALMERVEALENHVRSTSEQFEHKLLGFQTELASAEKERDTAKNSTTDATTRLASREQALRQMQEEVGLLEKRALDAEQKVSLLLDQVENSVDNYRRRSRISGDQERPAVPAASNGLGHTRQESSDAGSIYGSTSGVGEARNSAALDSLANELDMLRSHWETTNKNYRLSNAFDFEGPLPKKDEEGAGTGLSGSLADWRKRLDTEERENKTRGPQ